MLFATEKARLSARTASIITDLFLWIKALRWSDPDLALTQSMGYCARRDKDGDTQSISWHSAPGADKGVWKSTGGSGKFAGKQDSGWFQGTVSDGKMSVSKWGGTCK